MELLDSMLAALDFSAEPIGSLLKVVGGAATIRIALSKAKDGFFSVLARLRRD